MALTDAAAAYYGGEKLYDMAGDVNTLGSFKAAKRAQLLQFMLMGGDLQSLALDRQGRKDLPRSEKVRLGKQVFRAPTLDDILGQAQKFQGKILEQTKQTKEALKEIPEIADIFTEAGGGGMDFLDQAFKMLGEETLGAAAPGGLLFDQAPGLLGGVALGKAQFQRGIQERSRGQALDLLGLGGTPGFTPSAIGQGQNIGFGGALGAVGGFDMGRMDALNEALGLQLGIKSQQYAGVSQGLGGALQTAMMGIF
jgi:hypothetical protein